MAGTIKECSVTENGQCAMHGVEVERRVNTTKRLDDAEKWISLLLTFKNIMIGISLLGSAVLFGNYIYTRDHIRTAERKYELLDKAFQQAQAERDQLEREMARLSADYARTDERYLAVTAQLGQMNGRLSQLVEIMLRNQQTQKVELQEMRHE